MNTRLTPKKIGIILLTIATALIHLGLAIVFLNNPDMQSMIVPFILNGLGYLGLLAAYFLPVPLFQERHNLVRWAFIAFAGTTIIAYFVINGIKADPIGLVTKVIEVALIVLLIFDRSDK